MSSEKNFVAQAKGNATALFAILQALAIIVFLSWRYGGMDAWGQMIAGCLSLPAPAITWLAWRQADASLRRRFLRVLLPLAGLSALIAISLFNPNMRVLMSEGRAEGLILRDDTIRFLPSSVLPADTLKNFLFNAGLILIGLNVFLARPERKLQRVLLGMIAVNAAALACAGTFFKLSHATAIFGTLPSPNPNFFASFVYYNHWGAFALLGAAASAALALDYFHHRAPSGEWLQTPAALLALFTLLLLVTLPLSRARASSAAGFIFALFIGYRLLSTGRSRQSGWSRWMPVGTLLLIGGLAVGWLAQEQLRFIYNKTARQVADVKVGGIGDARAVIYRDTWNLFLQRPVFGWGWNSYHYAFYRVQSSEFRMQNEQKTRTVVHDAHNDWLQLLAELGVAGAALALATLVAIARLASARWWKISPSAELAAGAVCLALLACVDFPFACPVVVLTAWTLLMTGAAIAYDREHRV